MAKANKGNELVASLPPAESIAPGYGRQYGESVIRKARDLWAFCNYQDSEIEKMLGIGKNIVAQWRKKSAPDGKDWYELKEMSGGNNPIVGQKIGIEAEIHMLTTNIDRSQRIIARCLSSLDNNELYDKDGEVVEFLFDSSGKKVPIGGIRAKSMAEVTSGIDAMTKLTTQSMARLQEINQESVSHEQELVEIAGRILSQLDLTPEQKAKMLDIINDRGDGTTRSLIGLVIDDAKSSAEATQDEAILQDGIDYEEGDVEAIEDFDEVILDDDLPEDDDGEWESVDDSSEATGE